MTSDCFNVKSNVYLPHWVMAFGNATIGNTPNTSIIQIIANRIDKPLRFD